MTCVDWFNRLVAPSLVFGEAICFHDRMERKTKARTAVLVESQQTIAKQNFPETSDIGLAGTSETNSAQVKRFVKKI